MLLCIYELWSMIRLLIFIITILKLYHGDFWLVGSVKSILNVLSLHNSLHLCSLMALLIWIHMILLLWNLKEMEDVIYLLWVHFFIISAKMLCLEIRGIRFHFRGGLVSIVTGMILVQIYTENWVNSPGQMEDNSWQAFVYVPEGNWYIMKVSSICISLLTL